MELLGYCTVCEAPNPTHEYGHRSYCETHFRTLYEDFPLLWRTSTVVFGVILVMVVALLLIDVLLGNRLSDTWRFVISVGVSVLPGMLWFFLLYRTASRARVHVPEPLPILAIAAVFLAAAAIHPFLASLLQLETWLSQTASTTRLIGLILLEGFPQAFLFYAAILFIAWRSVDFCRRVDGVLFTIVLGIGYSSTLNLAYALDHPTLAVLNGNLRLLTMQAAHLASGLALGYFVGHNRFEDMPPYFLAIGVSSSAILGGLMLYAGSELNNTGLGITQTGFSPWPGLVVGMLALAVIFATVRGLMQQQNDLLQAKLGSHVA